MDFKSSIFFYSFLCSCFHLSGSLYQSYSYKTYYYKQRVDHFSFSNQDTFSLRYLVSSKYWNEDGGPIFFYAGNEGDITLFAQNTGFMWEIAPEFKAMVMFAEHRYYGKSLPYGKKSFMGKNVGYLTSEQALADYADLLTFIKTSVKGASKSPVIVFGGSYGGMLAAWFRMKYPHIVDGAIAASAPILQFVGMTPCEKFGQLVTADFEKESKRCAQVIRQSWKAIDNKVKTASGSKWLSERWELCKPLNGTSDVEALKEYLTNVWTNLAMADYPYPASFLSPLPGQPIKMVCEEMNNPDLGDDDLLLDLFRGLSIYFNFTKAASCLNYERDATSLLGEQGWDYQSCTEMVMPFCYDGKKDFFEPSPWNFTDYSQKCYKQWRVMPRPFMVGVQYGGEKIEAASNIVFSNGLLDPWSTGGVLKNVTSSLIAIIIPEGAHHLDLRQSDPNDPPSVVEARNLEKKYISQWIAKATSSAPKEQPHPNAVGTVTETDP